MQNTGSSTGRWHHLRAAALGVLATVVVLGSAYAAWGGMLGELHRLERRSTVRTPDALPVLVWAALVLALLWAAVLICLATATLLRGIRGGTPGAGGAHDDTGVGGGPRAGGMVGRLAAVLLAVTALSSLGTAAPAFATTGPTVAAASATSSHGADSRAEHAAKSTDSCAQEAPPSPGWVPDKPARTDQVARDCAPLVTGKPVADDSGEVVVHRGDTLWSIAAAHLGPQADAAAIAAEWPHWYAANRHVIGDDPDRLSIGTRLQTPSPALEGSNR